MKTFKTWKLTFTADLVTAGNIDGTYLYEILWSQLQEHAGRCGYLIGSAESRIEQTSGEDE